MAIKTNKKCNGTAHLIVLTAIATLFLSACQSSSGDQGPARQTPSSEVSEGAPDGALPISVLRAEQVLSDFCIQQAPTFSGTAAIAVRYGLEPGSSPGRYVHPVERLAVGVEGGQCGMIFSSDADPNEIRQRLTALETPTVEIVFDGLMDSDGIEFYGVRAVPAGQAK